MIARREDSAAIQIGDDFISFSCGGNVFHEGSVDEVDEHLIFVDFGDFRVKYERIHVSLMEENCGYIRMFYGSPVAGIIVERYV